MVEEVTSTCGLGERAPASLAVLADVVDELLVLLLRPSSLVHVSLVTTRLPHPFALEEEQEQEEGEEQGEG